MFGIGMSEMIIILAVALLVFGPDKLPEIAKSISRGLKDLRKASDDLKSTVSMHLDDDEPRMRPRVKPTAGIPDPPAPSVDAGPNIPGSELAHGLDPLPPAEEPVVPRAAAGAVARGGIDGDAEDGDDAGGQPPAPRDEEADAPPAAAGSPDTHRSS